VEAVMSQDLLIADPKAVRDDRARDVRKLTR
jgi:putative ubiquitin-RnfH superfamily antitoxin RatB of RatAB toxin-antitoxin module